MPMPRIKGAAVGASLLIAASLAPAPVLAQGESESPSPAEAAEGSSMSDASSGAEGHWVAIHEGTCEQLGSLLFPLGRITRDLRVHSGDAQGREIGAATDQQLSVNVTLIDAALADLGAAEHALNVREAEDEASRSVACGDIGGTIIDGDTLLVRLDEENDSGEIGVGDFREEDGLTTVTSIITVSSSTVRSPMSGMTEMVDAPSEESASG